MKIYHHQQHACALIGRKGTRYSIHYKVLKEKRGRCKKIRRGREREGERERERERERWGG